MGTGPFYTIEDAFPVGHGSKSVYIMNRYLKLTDIETAAIAYHMGFSYGDDARTVGNVFGRFLKLSHYLRRIWKLLIL